MEKIQITCKGSSSLPIEKLKDFQGNLKTLDDKEKQKIKNSIKKYGFSFPVFVWKNKILDGHQRLYVVNEMLQNGYVIEDIPIAEIEARNAKEAAEKLLILNSHYAKMTEDGLDSFLNSLDIDLDELAEMLELPDVDIASFKNDFDEKYNITPEEMETDENQDNVIVKFSYESFYWFGNRHKILEDIHMIEKKYKIKASINE